MKVSELNTPTTVNQFRDILLEILVSNKKDRTILIRPKGERPIWVSVDDLNYFSDLELKYGFMVEVTPLVNINSNRYLGDKLNKIKVYKNIEEMSKNCTPCWCITLNSRLGEVIGNLLGEYYLQMGSF